LHAEGNPGLREALTTGRLSLQKFASNLSILTTGNAEAHDACTIAPAFIRRLTRACRSHFDAIFFDCGPILGSVEASVVAPEVDGVVFIVSRGQKPAQAKRALNQLSFLGARLLGVVYNRAKMSDFARSYPVSSSMRSHNGMPDPVKQTRKLDFGPVVNAVAMSLPALMAEKGAA
jgi:Mrp family chromosome partitioning ATPase